jgi:hypothetical protein
MMGLVDALDMPGKAATGRTILSVDDPVKCGDGRYKP